MKKQSCDVCIIGSGVGGLCTGALLAKQGYSVVVTERLGVPGGRCSTRSIKGFRIDTGVQMLYSRGPLADVFKLVGAKLELKYPRTLFSGIRINGKDHCSNGSTPADFFKLLFDHETHPERLMIAMKQAMSGQLPSDGVSVEEWFRQYTFDEKTLSRLQPFVAGTLGTNSNECSAAEFFRVFRVSATPSGSSKPYIGIPLNGSIEPMQQLVESIRKRNGHVWFNSPARNILVNKRYTSGVIVQNPAGMTEVQANIVVSNIAPRLMIEMAGQENFDTEYVRKVTKETVSRSTPITHIYIGSNRPLIEQEGLLLVANTRRLFQLYSPTNTLPEIAPRGMYLTIAAGMPRPCIEPISPTREFKLNLLDLRENLPGFEEHSEILMATTYHRDWPLYGTWPGRGLSQRTPIENLYLVGDRVLPRGQMAVMGCAHTAQLVVDLITD